VFFAVERDAVAAGFRPCAICLPTAYATWEVRSAEEPGRNPTD
jgi:methylphosphotriester-DNA--protein-cysteine methyltransferase